MSHQRCAGFADDNSGTAIWFNDQSAWLRVLPSENREDPAGWWPLRSVVELEASPSAVSCARLNARKLLCGWGLRNLSESAELVISELVTNAIRASGTQARPGPVRLALLSEGASVLVLVWDASLEPPVRVDADSDRESGRGLLLVQAFSARWAWYNPPEAGGKVVWALINAQAPSRGNSQPADIERSDAL